MIAASVRSIRLEFSDFPNDEEACTVCLNNDGRRRIFRIRVQ
jgi:hypothetical protein